MEKVSFICDVSVLWAALVSAGAAIFAAWLSSTITARRIKNNEIEKEKRREIKQGRALLNFIYVETNFIITSVGTFMTMIESRDNIKNNFPSDLYNVTHILTQSSEIRILQLLLDHADTLPEKLYKLFFIFLRHIKILKVILGNYKQGSKINTWEEFHPIYCHLLTVMENGCRILDLAGKLLRREHGPGNNMRQAEKYSRLHKKECEN
ncbi:MAG: hypothetical protein AB1814_04555 [Thermodesulfobacteriota bacterium]